MTATYASSDVMGAGVNVAAPRASRQPKRTTKPRPTKETQLVLEGALGFYNEDEYVCDGDVLIDERSLSTAIQETFWRDLPEQGSIGTVHYYGRFRVTVERVS